MNIKKIIISLAFVLTLFSVSAYAKTMQFTMGDFDAKVDEGNIVVHTMEVSPYTVDGRTMVPARIVAETFGADVDWVDTENKVLITLGDKNISLVIGELFATVNGEQVTLDVPSVETNGRTLVPLRFVSETLGFDVKYVASTQQILITNDIAPIEINGAKVPLASFDALYDYYYLQFGSVYGEAGVASLVQIRLMNYAISDVEADKWEITLPVDYYEGIAKTAAEISSLFPDTLDAVWANLIETETKEYELNAFLAQRYMPDEATAEKYYKENYMAAKHILLLAETENAKSKIKDIKKQITSGADFDELMNEYSEDTGLVTNPDGYYFTTGQMVQEFEDAVKKLKAGNVSGIVETDYGYHIIKRINLPAFDETVYQTVASYVAKDGVAKHLSDIAEAAEIKADAYTLEELVEICK